MKQIVFCRFTASSSTTHKVMPFTNQAATTFGFAGQAQMPLAAAGTMRNLRGTLSAAPGGTATRTYTVHKNDAATGLVLAFGASDTMVTDATNSVTFAVGDTVHLAQTHTSTPAAADVELSFEWEGANANETVYGFGGDPHRVSTYYNGAFVGFGLTEWGGNTLQTSPTSQASLAACSGTITALYMKLLTAPGSGKSWIFSVVLNGVDQDGSGTTTDTRVTIADAATTGNATFSLAVASGDLVSIKSLPVNTPAQAFNAGGSVAFTSTSPGQGQFGVNLLGAPDNYIWPYGSTADPSSATESLREYNGNPSSFTLSGLRVYIYKSDGSALTIGDTTFTLRQNGADTALTLTVSGTSVTSISDAYSGADTVDVTDGDTISLHMSGGSGAATVFAKVVFIQGTPVDVSVHNLLTGSLHTVTGNDNLISGANGTVAGDLNVLHSLDGSPHTLTADNTFAVYANEIILSGTLIGASPALRVLGQFGSITSEAGSSGTAKTINWDAGNAQRLVLTDDVTLTLANPQDGFRYLLVLEQDAGSPAAFTVTWPSNVIWPSGTEPTLSTAAGAVDLIELVYVQSVGAGSPTGNYLAVSHLDYTPA